jgi:hypothetical protein
MAGRASLDGPKVYNTLELEGPLLDLAVANANGIKAVLHLIDNPIGPFYECSVLNEDGRLHYQYIPSRLWTQGGSIIEDNKIDISAPDEYDDDQRWFAGCWRGVSAAGARMLSQARGETPLLAAMRSFVLHRTGLQVTL